MNFHTPARRALALAALLLSSASFAAPDLSTHAERSGFHETGRYAEVERLCRDFARAYPRAVRCIEFGRTPQGRAMRALVVSQSGALTPAAARRAGLPVTLIQGGIHAGEIEGKDAGFLALRTLLAHPTPALKRQVLVFVPVFNVDGHERFGPWNRPNQRGPAQMGWRVTAQNLNLNRDYAKAESPEMQAMLRLVNAWDPLVAVDLHTTDGAQFEHDVAVMVEPVQSGDEALRAAGRAWRDGVIERLAAQGSLPLPFYPAFVETDNPASGFKDGVSPPRFSTGYFVLRNRLGMLVETHSWKDYPTRVHTTRKVVDAVLELVAQHGAAWQHQAREADARAAKLTDLALTYDADDSWREIEFRGVAYTRTPSPVSGALMTRYDESRPVVWRLPLREHVVPTLTVAAPGAGYLVPVEYSERVATLLARHGIRFERVREAQPALAVHAFRVEKITRKPESFEGRTMSELSGRWGPETRALPAGSLFVPIAQPLARLVMNLLEPQAPDSMASWGSFDAAFEIKEGMEAYVAEALAREQLAINPALAAAFEAQLRSDPAFAASPEQRLNFFYRRHASWDERAGLYPVLRLDKRLR